MTLRPSFSSSRYATLEGNGAKWDHAKSVAENLKVQDWGFCPGTAWQPGLEPYYAQLLAAAGVADPDAMVCACAEAHRLLAKENQTPALLAEVRANGWASELDMQPDTPWPELSSEAWRKHEAGGAR